MSTNYAEMSTSYGLSETELQKADITLAALFNGYMLKREDGKDDMFFKPVQGGKMKSITLPQGANKISSPHLAIIENQLGVKENGIDSKYFDSVIKKYNEESADLLIERIHESMVNNNSKDSQELISFYAERIMGVAELNRNRVTESESGR